MHGLMRGGVGEGWGAGGCNKGLTNERSMHIKHAQHSTGACRSYGLCASCSPGRQCVSNSAGCCECS